MLAKPNENVKYVNMADIIEKHGQHASLSDADAVTLIELLFFAYRDFVSDPDTILGGLKFGRAHHRVLHFVGRAPGMTVAQLLEILKITKQSLSRVLKDLIEQGYIVQKEGAVDRRQRLLSLTEKGERLWRTLITPQMQRVRDAVGNNSEMQKLLFGLISKDNRHSIEAWLKSSHVVKPRA